MSFIKKYKKFLEADSMGDDHLDIFGDDMGSQHEEDMKKNQEINELSDPEPIVEPVVPPVPPPQPPDPRRNEIVPIPGYIVSKYMTKDGVLKAFPTFDLKLDGDIIFLDLSKLKGILEERWQGFVDLNKRCRNVGNVAEYSGILEVLDVKILYAVAIERGIPLYPRTNLRYSGNSLIVDRKNTEYAMMGVMLVSDLSKICPEADIAAVINSGVILYDYHDIMRVANSVNFVSKTAILISDSTRNYCETCNGSGRIPCLVCNNRGRINCEKCAGGTVKCETCEGLAKLEGDTECFDCSTGRVPCDFCQGNGYTRCEVCHGDRNIPCVDCKGKGNIIVDKISPLKIK